MSKALEDALSAWAAKDYYEAHEGLEDFADEVEDNDEAFEITIALIHVAAALHKWNAKVGEGAVPGKLARAIGELKTRQHEWMGLDLQEFVGRLKAFKAAIESDPAPRDLAPPKHV